ATNNGSRCGALRGAVLVRRPPYNGLNQVAVVTIMPKLESGAWGLHAGMEHALQSLTSQPAMLALLFELKLKRKRVRITSVERRRIRAAAEEYFRTNDVSVFKGAVVRSRKIHIRFTSKDLRLLTDILTDTVEATITKTTKDLSTSLEPKMRRWADQECA